MGKATKISKADKALLRKPRGFDAEVWQNLGEMQQLVLCRMEKSGSVYSPAELGDKKHTSSRITTVLRTLTEKGLVQRLGHGQYQRP